MSEPEEDDDQGTWEHIRPEPKRITGRKDGRAPHDFVDVSAFGRLVKKYGRSDGTIDGRPNDAKGDQA